jgi:predicted cupin superfamily sugar epimerase
MLSADEVIRLLELHPHPEGGHYRETFRDPAQTNGRAASTAVYYLLREGEVSRWHRVDASEVWHWYAGASLELRVSGGEGTMSHVLGPDLAAGDRPQAVVPPNAWQTARSLGPWTLIGCTVAPGFEFSGFELAPEGWEPSARDAC